MKTTSRAAFSTGKVSVMRFGGGLGESVIEATCFPCSSSRGWPGKREAVCPSGPMPSRMASKCTGSLLACFCVVKWRRTWDRMGRRQIRSEGCPIETHRWRFDELMDLTWVADLLALSGGSGEGLAHARLVVLGHRIW
jgi:hypothetical protein